MPVTISLVGGLDSPTPGVAIDFDDVDVALFQVAYDFIHAVPESPVSVPNTITVNNGTNAIGVLEGDWPAPLTMEQLMDVTQINAWLAAAAGIQVDRVRITTPDYIIEIDFDGAGPTAADFVANWSEADLLALDPIVNGGGGDEDGPSEDDDVIAGTSDPDDIAGLGGDDDISGEGGNDLIHGNDGADVISGGTGNDRLFGDAGNDVIRGGGGEDRIFGGGGRDTLFGGLGDDVIRGGVGNDILRGGGGADTLRGDAGADRIFGNGGADTLDGGGGRDRLVGGGGNDVLSGGAGNDRLLGGAGEDTLNGGAGNDFLFGGDRADTLIDSLGDDMMTGGAGADTFVFNEGSGGNDTITDYNARLDGISLRDVPEALSGLTGFALRDALIDGGADIDRNGRTITVDIDGNLLTIELAVGVSNEVFWDSVSAL